GFLLLAPESGPPPHYALFVEAPAAGDAALAQLAGAVERRLGESPSYAYCRRLGQLDAVCAVRVGRGASEAYLGRCRALGEAVGVGSRSITRVFVNGRPRDVGYLGDLRLLPAYRGRTVLARGYRLLRDLHADGRTDLYFTVIAADNAPALSTIAAGRAGLPS